MEHVHRALLRRLRVELSDQLLVSDTIVPLLYQEDVLTEAHVQDIESERTEGRKVLRLLDLLPGRGPRAFRVFLRSLQDFPWVRDRLLHELQAGTPTGSGSTDLCRLPDPVLHKVPSDQELSRLASRLGSDWEVVLMDLGLSVEAMFRCRSDHSLSTQAAALAGLVQWRRSEGRRATVERLMQSLHAAGADPNIMEDVLTRPT